MKKILSGIRVLDFTDALAGPFCTRYLADCGAEVINVERPGGKAVRRIPQFFQGFSVLHLFNHCGKKSVGVDLKQEGARALLLELAKRCDVVVENFRPGVMAELGLDYAAFQRVSPSIVMCSISGWGQEGPYADRMGADLSVQAGSGIVHLTGESEAPPSLVGFPVTDVLAGLNAFGAICAALFRRAVTGEGEYIDIAMADCAVACLQQAVGVHTLSGGRSEVGRSGRFSEDMPSWGVFKGRDGYLALSAATKIGWERLADVMGRPELADDPRFATREARLEHNDEVVEAVEEWLQAFDSVADVAVLLQTYRIQAAPVQTVAQVVDEDPQFAFREMLKPVDHPVLGTVRILDTPLKFRNAGASVESPPAAHPGADTDEVLEGLLELESSRLQELKNHGVIFGSGVEPAGPG